MEMLYIDMCERNYIGGKGQCCELQQNPDTGKDLQEELSAFKSLRLKKYRVIVTIREEKNYIEIYHIGRRSDVYEQFRRLLTELQKPDD